ncbi:MAG: DNA polymerase III subunit gamma/tau [Halieaceae bacterium]|jgi:DNA polymerase-3 subunit gamma/tau|nr:DNA polymerase III subunit gamma/tau [Halieaceae bacterium]
MSYQVLARKWRPKTFREMVGQEHVLQALVNALDHDRLHHAYLFTGTRGVGKTTIARILAKCLNCETGVSSEPCGQCSSCLEIAEGRSVDLLEVDAASRTKVEDTRELLENVQYAPTRSRYKVYLIDEVHMLSSHSFNALLKTLEEPPPHVKFLLATTDPQKLPVTILSRCLQFNLKNMPPEQIVGHLRNVLGQEMIAFDEPSLWLLARSASGSMRDALSLTDQAISFGSGKLTEDEVRSMLGSVDLSFIYQLLEALVANDAAGLLAIVAHMAEHAPDFESSLDELISMLHRVAVAQVVPDAIDNSWGDAERVAQLAGSMTAEDTQLFYQMALNGKRDITLATDPRSGFEMILLRMVAFRPAAVIDESLTPGDLAAAAPAVKDTVAREVDETVKKPVRAPEAAPAAGAEPPGKPPDEKPPEKTPEPQSAAAPVRPAAAGQGDADTRQRIVPGELRPDQWHSLLEQLGLGGIVYTIALNSELRSCSGNALEFVLDQANAALFNKGHVEQIRLALEKYFGHAMRVTIEPGETAAETPARRQARLQQERQQAAVASIEADPLLQKLIARFDGELDRASITPVDP